MTNCEKMGSPEGREMGSATGGAHFVGTPNSYMSMNSELVPRRAVS
jgi:hypothetical protein